MLAKQRHTLREEQSKTTAEAEATRLHRLLMRVDKMTMATAVEARVPFLDHKLIEYVMSIPQDRKVPDLQPKYLLKKAVRGVIPELQRRGLFRTEYEGTTLRESLGLPRPSNRFFDRKVAAAE